MATSSKPKVLFVLTSHNKLGDTGKPTGWFLPEMAHPYHVLKPHVSITVASPAGGEAPLDQGSVEAFKNDEISTDFLKNEETAYKDTQKLSAFIGHASEFDAIFFIGGYGPMFDLPNDEISKSLTAEFYEAGKIVAAVCHGPAALLNVKLSNGEYLVQDQPVTAFSNAEEDSVDLSKHMPFMLETELINRGAKYEKAAEPWSEKVCIGRGGRLITGQNPASAGALGEEIKKALKL
ncbi:uncharacterized protein H6S33_004408 [Morchella sextelata]|uniref:uncharacterized protein n=1 Tax=Morchella sextelata TaxID=1174677 RepID=UPI001D052E24|nr:uncharacterized protein H6S33_004408 [Morchella sextelata]KAH0605951.1 hypothetical protein H6S33_004408 [Morchella sextelata]